MATQVQNRRGTTAEHSTFTGANGELTVDTTKKTVVVHDGTTAGGAPLLRENGSQNAVTTGTSTAASFIPTSSTVPTNGVYLPAANTIGLATNSNGRVFVDSQGRVGIGDNLPDSTVTIKAAAATTPLRVSGPSSEFLRCDQQGRLLVGTSTSLRPTGLVQIAGSAYPALDVTSFDTSSNPEIILRKARGSQSSPTVVASGDSPGKIFFQGYDGSDYRLAAIIESAIDGTPGASDMPGRLVFSTTADGASSPTERMRIDRNGNAAFGTGATVNAGIGNTSTGATLAAEGYLACSRSAAAPLYVNRSSDDGTLVDLRQDGNAEGTISVSGTTVSYNGAHLSRWSQLPDNDERVEILRGTVLSNIDEMCEWGDEENEQLNRMKVSDVEGDKNVSGVFQAWDDDDDTYTNDFYCAMTGDFIIRIGAGVTVERGDLLMSAGDGTAKPQGDGYVQDKTIAKVTSTNVSCTYPDGSYCVPCVLMAC